MKNHNFNYLLNGKPLDLSRRFTLNQMFQILADQPDGTLTTAELAIRMFDIKENSSGTKIMAAHGCVRQTVARLRKLLEATDQTCQWLVNSKNPSAWALANKPVTVTETYNNTTRTINCERRNTPRDWALAINDRRTTWEDQQQKG